MGHEGTDAAREVADVVLQTDDLAALSLAVEYGRTTYTNVRKSIRYLLNSNISEVAVVLAATAAGFGEPLSVPQLLWINLLSDVMPALGLALRAAGRRCDAAATAIPRRECPGRARTRRVGRRRRGNHRGWAPRLRLGRAALWCLCRGANDDLR